MFINKPYYPYLVTKKEEIKLEFSHPLIKDFSQNKIKSIAYLLCCYLYKQKLDDLVKDFYAINYVNPETLLNNYVNNTYRYKSYFNDEIWFKNEYKRKHLYSQDYKYNWFKKNRCVINSNTKLRHAYIKYLFQKGIFNFFFKLLPYIITPLAFLIFGIIYANDNTFLAILSSLLIPLPLILIYISISCVIYYKITGDKDGDIYTTLENIKSNFCYTISRTKDFIDDFEEDCSNQVKIFSGHLKLFSLSIKALSFIKNKLESLNSEFTKDVLLDKQSFVSTNKYRNLKINNVPLYFICENSLEILSHLVNKSTKSNETIADVLNNTNLNPYFFQVNKQEKFILNYIRNSELINDISKCFPSIFNLLNLVITDYPFPNGEYGSFKK